MKNCLLIVLSLVLLSCNGDRWVCNCEQMDSVNNEVSEEFGDSYHVDGKILNNYYKSLVKSNCEKRKPTSDSCDIIINI